MISISPNTRVIEKLITCYKAGRVTMIYGNSASGKTTSCFLAAIEAAKQGKVIFVDTESGFNTERIKQLSNEKIEKILQNIFLFQPVNYKEQHDFILKMKKLCANKKIKLVIVDTIGHYYRNLLNEKPRKVNQMMVDQMATLVRIARDLDKAVLLTNQVYADMDTKDGIKMVGGRLIPNMCKTIIELHKRDNERYASLIKYKLEEDNITHYNVGKKIKFEIKEKGLFSPE